MNEILHRRRAAAWLVMVAAIILSLVCIRLFGLLVGASIVFIAVETIIAVDLHLLGPRSRLGRSGKSSSVFRLRTYEEAIISIALAIAGIATLVGVLHGGKLAGWVAVGAGAGGAANIIATRRSTVAGTDKP